MGNVPDIGDDGDPLVKRLRDRCSCPGPNAMDVVLGISFRKGGYPLFDLIFSDSFKTFIFFYSLLSFYVGLMHHYNFCCAETSFYFVRLR